MELVPEGVPSYAVGDEMSVILKVDRKIFLNVAQGPAQNGKQGNGVSYGSCKFCGFSPYHSLCISTVDHKTC